MNEKKPVVGAPGRSGYDSIMMLDSSTPLRLRAEQTPVKTAPMPEPAVVASSPSGIFISKRALWVSIFIALFTLGCCWVIACLRGL